MMKTFAHLSLITVFAIALSGCDQQPAKPATDAAQTTTAAKSAVTNACDLVTAGDVQAAFGQTVETASNDGDTCIYNGMGNTAAFMLLTISLTPNQDDDTAKQAYQMMLKMQAGMGEIVADVNQAVTSKGGTPPVGGALPDLGDEALYQPGNDSPMAITQATVRKGRIIFSMAATGMEKQHADAFLALLRQSAAKL